MNLTGLTQREMSELGRSTLIVGLVFTIASRPGTDLVEAALVFAVSIVAAGAGFFFHELMHKFTAQRMGYRAEYHMGDFPYVSILFAFAGWIFLSPGAVHISAVSRPITRGANGLISLAGPLTNLMLALAFFGLSFGGPILHMVGAFGYRINIWLAVFNTLPAPTFDGKKIWDWNKALYIGFGVILAGFFLLLRP